MDVYFLLFSHIDRQISPLIPGNLLEALCPEGSLRESETLNIW